MGKKKLPKVQILLDLNPSFKRVDYWADHCCWAIHQGAGSDLVRSGLLKRVAGHGCRVRVETGLPGSVTNI